MQIGPYQLTRCLGQGGMGEVWLGKRSAMGSAAKIVAVKLLRSADPAARDNFIQEAKLAMLLRHSTIVQVNDVGESGGTCFMEMEWVDGLDLSRLTEQLRQTGQKLELDVAAYVIGELLKALAFAHALDVDGKRETIVHRDVTPQNVLISKSGEVKLTDFGIAFLTSDKSQSDLIKGKARYMSPEHVRQVREPCIDIFGVGAIFHEMLDGRKFRYTAQSDVDLLSMAFAGDVPSLSIELPAELEQLRRGLLARDLDARFATPRAALAALRRWPGYRDASEELAQLVADAAVDNTPLAMTTPLPAAALERVESTTTEQDDAAHDGGSGTDVGPAPAASQRDQRSDKRVLAAVLVLVGLGFGGLGASMLVKPTRAPDPSAVRSPIDQVAERSEVTPAEPMTAPNEPRNEPPKVVATEPTAAEPPPVVEPTSVVGEEPPIAKPIAAPIAKPIAEPPAEDTTSEPNPKPVAKAKTAVTLAASGYPWVKIRIGSSIYKLDRRSSRTKKISLKPGSHEIAFRVDDEEPWQELGKVSIPAQDTARLTLQKPGKVIIE